MNENTKARLYQKILAVQQSLEPLEKTGRNDFHKYSYSTAGNVLLPVQRACNQQALIIVADCIESNIEPGRASCIVRLTVADSETGETLSVTAPGYAEDFSHKDNRPSGDKAIYKALTGATKYAVRSFFCLPSEDDPERTHSKQATSSKGVEPRASRQVAYTTDGSKNITVSPKSLPADSFDSSTSPALSSQQQKWLIQQTDIELKRLRWSHDQGRLYLQQHFGKSTRQTLTLQELQQFLSALKLMQPSQTQLAK